MGSLINNLLAMTSEECEYTLQALPYHLVHAGAWDKLERLLSDLEFLQAKVEYGMSNGIISDYQLAEDRLSQPGAEVTNRLAAVRAVLGEFASAFSQELHTFQHSPPIAAQQIFNNLYAHNGFEGQVGAILAHSVERHVFRESTWLRRLNIAPSSSIPRTFLRTLAGHTGPVISLAIAPDGTKIASGGLDGTICIWQAQDGAMLTSFAAHADGVTGLIWRSCGRDSSQLISAGCDGYVRIWDWETEQEQLSWVTPTQHIRGLALLTAQGPVVTCGDDRAVRGWNIATGDALWRLLGHLDRVFCLAADTNGANLFSGSEDQTLKVWSADQRRCIATLRGNRGAVSCLAVDPSGNQAVAGDEDGTLTLWDIRDRRLVRTLQGHRRRIRSITIGADPDDAVSPTPHQTDMSAGIIVSSGDDETLRLWDLATGTLRDTLRGPVGGVNALAIAPDARWFASANEDGTVGVWRVPPREGTTTRSNEHEARINCLAVHPHTGHLLSGSDDETITVWHAEHGKYQLRMRGHFGPVTCLTTLRDGLAVSGSKDRRLRVWDSTSGALLRTFGGLVPLPNAGQASDSHMDGLLARRGMGHRSTLTCLTAVGESHILSGSYDRTVCLWNLETGNLEQVFIGANGMIHSIVFSASLNYVLAAGGAHDIAIWNLDLARVYAYLEGHTSSVTCLALNGDELISGSRDRTIRLWDLRSARELRRLEGHRHWVRCIAVDTDRSLLVSGGNDAAVRIWDLLTGTTVYELTGHTAPVRAIALDTRGGRVISCADDQQVIVWDLNSGQALAKAVLDSPATCMALVGEARVCLGTHRGGLVLLQFEKAS